MPRGLRGRGRGARGNCKPAPVQAAALGNSVTAVGTGDVHTCAVRTEPGPPGASLWCWGANFYGQLGDGQTANSKTPVQVVLKDGSTEIQPATPAIGMYHSCARGADGSAWCWGTQAQGQVGNGVVSNVPEKYPYRIDPLGVSVLALASSAPASHTCAVRTDGQAWCWGHNLSLQIAPAAQQQQAIPYKVPGTGPGAAAVATGGGHSCALLAAGHAMCWGANGYGQVGSGSVGGPACQGTCTIAPVKVAMPCP